jgi:hypothetical protein
VIHISRASGIRTGIALGHCQSKLSSVKLAQKSSPFNSIRLLTYNPGYTFKRYYVAGKKASASGDMLIPSQPSVRAGIKYSVRARRAALPSNIRISPKLSIYAGKQEYSIPCADLCEAEQQWLDKEFSDLLGLSLQRLDPTDADLALTLRKEREKNLADSDSFFLM